MTIPPLWIVVDIGCIECGEGTSIVGLFSDRDTARTVADNCNGDSQFTWRGGQHAFEVFQLTSVNAVNPDYQEALP